jgi:TonB family protein
MRSMIGAGVMLAVLLGAGAPGAQGQVKVGTAEAVKAAVKKPQPEYNPLAKQMRVSGEVEVEVQITDKGEVDGVKVISGNALLTSSVVKAVKEWKFQPFEENGKASAAIASLRFKFQ